MKTVTRVLKLKMHVNKKNARAHCHLEIYSFWKQISSWICQPIQKAKLIPIRKFQELCKMFWVNLSQAFISLLGSKSYVNGDWKVHNDVTKSDRFKVIEIKSIWYENSTGFSIIHLVLQWWWYRYGGTVCLYVRWLKSALMSRNAS